MQASILSLGRKLYEDALHKVTSIPGFIGGLIDAGEEEEEKESEEKKNRIDASADPFDGTVIPKILLIDFSTSRKFFQSIVLEGGALQRFT